MRIVYLSASILPSETANSVQVMKMCAAFRRRGHEVHLIARGPDEDPEPVFQRYGVAERFRIHRVGWPRIRGLGGWIYGRRARARVRDVGHADLLYARDVYSLYHLRDRGCPMIYEAHAVPGSRLRRHLEGRLFREAHLRRLVVVSSALARAYGDLFPGLPRGLISVAPDGADPATPDPGTVRVQMRGRAPAFHVGYVGHLYGGKGMEIIAELVSMLPECEFHVVGGTAADVHRWRRRLDRENLHFYGHVPHAETATYLRCFDAVLAPYQRRVSVHGGGGDVGPWMSPLKVFEYMAAGRPIVASDLPVLREILEPEVTALLCDPDDPAAWAGALRRLRSEPETARRLGAQAEAAFRQRYTWSRRVEAVLA